MRADGGLATTPHPPPLGSALTHPRITTDFSESQLELITGVHTSAEACVRELTEIHQVVYRAIGDELLWCASMPCGLPAENAIPLGRYGSSNIGRAKSVYRMGLSHRYGRRMQTICGIHYNFSLPNHLSNDAYFGLIRNFRRNSWLLLYLFGASPAVWSIQPVRYGGSVRARRRSMSSAGHRCWWTSITAPPPGCPLDQIEALQDD